MSKHHAIRAIVKYTDNTSLAIDHVFSIHFNYFDDMIRIYFISPAGERTRCIISNSCIIGIYFKSIELR